MSSHEDGGLWEPVVLTPADADDDDEVIPGYIHSLNAQGQELSWWYQVTRGALLSSPSTALASLDQSNLGLPEEEDEDVEDDGDDEDEEEDGVCSASEESIQGLEKVRVEKGLGLEINPCPICLDEFEIRSEASKMPCNHVFHRNCIVEWLERSNMCPLCRYRMPKQEFMYLSEIFREVQRRWTP